MLVLLLLSQQRLIGSLHRPFAHARFWNGSHSRYVLGHGRYSLTAGHKMGEVCHVHPTLESIYSSSPRFGPDHLIDPSKDYTKLTLDAIALASMSYRTNSFYTVSRMALFHSFVLR